MVLLLLAFVAGVAWGSNTLEIGSVSGGAGDTVEVALEVANSDSFVAFQVDLPLPEQAQYIPDSAQLTGRSQGHQLSARVLGHLLRILAYSTDNKSFPGNSGTVAVFSLRLGTVPGTYSLHPQVAILSDASYHNILTGISPGSLTLLAPDIHLSRTQVTYERTPVPTYREGSFTVSNPGNLPLSLSCSAFPDVYSVRGDTSFVLAPSESRTVRVRFTALTKGSFQGAVVVSSDDPDAPRVEVSLDGLAYTINELHVNPAFGRSGGTCTVSLRINNYEPFVGFQSSLSIPSVLIYIPGSARLTGRKEDHGVGGSVLEDGKVRVVAYSTMNASFSGSDGDVVQLDFEVDGRGGIYALQLSDVLIVNSAEENIVSDFYGGNLEIAAPDIQTPGSLDYGRISRLDTTSVSILLRNTGSDTLVVWGFSPNSPAFWADISLPLVVLSGRQVYIPTHFYSYEPGEYSAKFTLRSSDPDEDPSYILLSGESYSPNSLRVQDGDGPIGGRTDIWVEVDNFDPFVAFQVDIEMPECLSVALDSCGLTDRADGHVLGKRQLGERIYRFLAYSTGGKAFYGNSGPVLRVACEVVGPIGGYTVGVHNALLSDVSSQNLLSGAQGGTFQSFPPVPVLTVFAINGGISDTQDQVVTLNNSATNAPTHYIASEDPGFSEATWEPYSAAPSFTVSSGHGTKTVYLKVKNAGGESSSLSDTIDYLPVQTISGKVTYYKDVNRAVSGVVLSLEEIGVGVVDTDTSDAEGRYELLATPGKSYRVVPDRDGSDASAKKTITLTDVAYLLQYKTGKRTVPATYSSYQVVASEVKEDGNITLTDAAYLLQYKVGKRTVFPSEFWRFVASDSAFSPLPVSGLPMHTYVSLQSDKVDQDYVGIHVGDTNGSWTSSMGKPAVHQSSGIAVCLGEVRREQDSRTLSAMLSVAPGEGILGVDVEIRYCEGALRVREVLPTESTEEYLLVSNLDEPGVVRFAMVNADPLSDHREVPMAQIVFDIKDVHTDPDLRIVNAMLADVQGDIPMECLDIRRDTKIPVVSSLSQNYPNPFNPQTTIAFSISEEGPVSLRIYSSSGQLIRVLVDDTERFPGYYSVLWDGLDDRGRDVGSGVYFCRMVSGSFGDVKKIILLR